MKRFSIIRLSLFGIVATLLTGCGKDAYDFGEEIVGDQEGNVEFSVTADHRTNTTTRADVGLLNVDDFTFEIFNSNGVKIKKWEKFSDVKGQKVRFNKGNFTAKAYYGDSLATGFDVVYYAGKTDFFVNGQSTTPVMVTCTQGNVQAKVVWGDHIKADYTDFSVKIYRKGESDKGVTFSKTETRSGFLPAGTLLLEIYLQDNAGGTRTYTTPEYSYSANDFVTFNIDTKESSKYEVGVTFTIDDATIDKPITITVPATLVAKEAPKFNVEGFTESSDGYEANFIEGVGVSGDLYVGINAPGFIKSCVLTTVSDAMPAEWPETIDLTDETDASINLVKSYGISWSELKGQSYATISFADLTRKIMKTASGASNDFTLTVTDQKGKETTVKLSLKVTDATIAVNSLPSYDMWATKAYITAITSDGDPERLSLQYSSNGGASWITPESGNIEVVETTTDGRRFMLSGLDPDTEYSFRAIYNNTYSEPQTGRTEPASQLGNSGFEEWTTREVVSYQLFSASYQKVFDPYSSGGEKWWDSNNSETTKKSSTPGYLTFKCFPMVSYTTGRSGYAAQIMAVAVNGANTSGTSLSNATPAELFLGTYGGETGHDFSSRPSSLSFYFEYTPKGSGSDDTFDVEVKVMSGTDIIGSGTLTRTVQLSQPVTSWSLAEVPITYSETGKSATSIQVRFRSSTSSEPPYIMNTSVTLAGENYNCHGGSILLVDEIELKY